MSHMEMIFIDSDRQARKTGVGAMMDTPAKTWEAFRSVRPLEVEVEQAEFLLDYYNRNGELADTIAISRSTFERITGQKALTEQEYRDIDKSFWSDLRSELRAAHSGQASHAV
ncbi:MAG: hypothetical protein DI562_17955 [Stenotrophomonas acidaminiphila]|nr:MAG: hypothetical protein DI562_17955 [Stenotrophomonas acidaminiphila]